MIHISLLDPTIETIVRESELTSGKRNDLPDEVFGLPDVRKFPIHDKAHVSSAITYFRTATGSQKKELAGRINTQAKKLGMTIKVSKDNPFYKYADKSILED